MVAKSRDSNMVRETTSVKIYTQGNILYATIIRQLSSLVSPAGGAIKIAH